ncbi:hypothetical protein FPOAC2_07563 [Fusarium poae]|nr:hypothetical protein FPOAC1_007652 [Fusarium poae]KAG8668273.1 hypothetical protein FPOAC1_007652 [Fusarium poae]
MCCGGSEQKPKKVPKHEADRERLKKVAESYRPPAHSWGHRPTAQMERDKAAAIQRELNKARARGEW